MTTFYIELIGSLLLLACYLPLIGQGRRDSAMADLTVMFSILHLGGWSALGLYSEVKTDNQFEVFQGGEGTLILCYVAIFMFLFSLTLSNPVFDQFRLSFLKIRTSFMDPLFFMIRRLDLVRVKGYFILLGSIWMYRLSLIALFWRDVRIRRRSNHPESAFSVGRFILPRRTLLSLLGLLRGVSSFLGQSKNYSHDVRLREFHSTFG